MNKRATSILCLLLLLIILLMGMRLYLQDTLSNQDVVYVDLEEQIQVYKQQNSLLYDEILTKSSLQYIEQTAKSLGFIDGKNLVLY